MSRESILKIRETEERAAQTVDAAKARARETVERAEREGHELCDRTEAEAMAQYTEVIQKIRERSLVLAEKNQTETNEEIAKLRREVSLRRKIAEKIITPICKRKAWTGLSRSSGTIHPIKCSQPSKMESNKNSRKNIGPLLS